VWNQARSAQQIQQAKDAAIAVAPGLLGRWGLDEGTGATVGDSTTHGNTGTLAGGTAWITTGLAPIAANQCVRVSSPGCCVTDADCNDGLACTADVCSGNTCQHSPIPACCTTGADCSDGDACTSDACENNVCVHAAIANCCTSDAACDDGTACTVDSCSRPDAAALRFDGVDDRVSMGPAAGLNASPAFTVETWFNWTGAGVSASTGTGGISAIPLVTKGQAEAETPPNVNMNYFLGITSAGRLAADFEDAATGLNHPACAAASTPAIGTNTWHHAAAVYDGTCWRLYLDGVAQTIDTACSTCSGAACTVCPSATPEPNSTQHFGLGTALTSGGVTTGAFGGSLDEVRVWNQARSAQQIQQAKDAAIAVAPALLGRWGLDEGTGVTAGDSTSPAENGTLAGGTAWITAGLAPIAANQCVRVPSPGCCVTDADCNDGLACTVDVCSGNACQHSPIPSCCVTSADCNDGNVCTTDACQSNVCVNTAVPNCCTSDAACDDGNTCTADTCSTANVAAVRLNGTTNGVVDFGNHASITGFGTGSFTVEGWVNVTTIPATNLTGIFRHGRQGTFSQVAVQLTGTGTGGGTAPFNRLAVSVETTAGTAANTQVDTPTTSSLTLVTTGQWTHFAAVIDRTPGANQVRLYVNGVLASSVNPTNWGTFTIATTDNVVLGAARASGGGLTAPLSGLVDEVRIWNGARTAQQILDNRNAQILSAAGLLARWGLNEGTGTTTANSAGPANGILGSGATWELANIPTFGNNQCRHTAAPDGTTCNDNSLCTTGETCQAGTCSGGASVVCAASDQCHDAGVCNPATGACSNPAKPDGTACTDGSACTNADTCQGGACTGGVPVVCTTSDQCHDAGTCNPSTGACSNPAKPDGAACTDGNACTSGDSCQAGACAAGAPVVCTASDQCHEPGTCNPATGVCSNPAKADGTLCDDGSPCTVGETCQSGACTGGQGQTCDDHNPCTTDTCDLVNGCSFTPVQNGTACDDGNACTTADSCQSGTCTGGPLVVCTASDQCHDAGTCNPATGLCSNPAKPDGAACSDGNACTTADSCQGGSCTAGAPVVCTASDQCHDAGTCNPATGACSNPAKPDGAACADGSACTTLDSCQGGTCTGGAPVVCTASDQCHDAGVCSPATGACSNPAKPDGTACSDGNACTSGDSCQAGVCTGGTAPPEVCNNLDDDCDGLVDEGNPGGGLPCSTGQPGVCAAGMTQCLAGAVHCVGSTAPATARVVAEFGTAMKYRANGSTAVAEDRVLVQFESEMRYLANSADPGGTLMQDWKNEGFSDTAWTAGRYGVGYETAPPGASALIKSPVTAGTFSVLTRARFDITDVTQVKSLLFGADYDDGYVAYLNGAEVARSSTMPAGDPAWNTNAALHESSNGTAPNYGTLVDISAAGIPHLHNGMNVLAVGVWNSGAPASTDLVVVPKLSIGLDWTARLYDDSSWTNGRYGVGYETAPPGATALLSSTVAAGTLSVFTRARFTLSAADLAAVQGVFLSADYDDGYVAWLNGVEIFGSAEMPIGTLFGNTNAALHESSNGATPNYGPLRDVTSGARPLLREGENVLAVGVWNSGGSTSTDLVLVPRLSLGEAEACNGLDDDCDGVSDEGFRDTDNDGAADCVDPNDDNDAVPDADDCAPLNSGATGAAPAEVAGFQWSRGPARTPILTWDDQGFASGIRYDLAGGLAASLRPDGGVSNAACVLNDLAAASFDDTRAGPAAGGINYYIVRAQKDHCADGTYGFASSGAERRPTSALACP
jgi:hypothetical protein